MRISREHVSNSVVKNGWIKRRSNDTYYVDVSAVLEACVLTTIVILLIVALPVSGVYAWLHIDAVNGAKYNHICDTMAQGKPHYVTHGNTSHAASCVIVTPPANYQI